MKPQRIPVGVNYPWGAGSYGWDFGNPPPGWGVPRWKTQLPSDLAQFSDRGIFAVRWFVFADGLNFGVGRYAPYPDPTPPQWRFFGNLTLQIVQQWMAPVLRDFETLLKEFQRHNRNARRKVLLLPSLVDFHWCFPAKCPVHQAHPKNCPSGCTLSSRFVKGGRADVLIDNVKRQLFFEGVLDPLLNLSLNYKDHIHAWEIMNEPEWVTDDARRPNWFKRIFTSRDPNRTVSKTAMIQFLKEGVQRIKAKRFKATIGFASARTLTEWGDLGADFHQVHYYPKSHDQTSKEHPQLRKAPRTHCIIGEFATVLDLPVKEDPDPAKAQGPDGKPDWWWLGASDDVYYRLKFIQNQGYESAFLWSCRATDKVTDWSATTTAAVKKFTSGN